MQEPKQNDKENEQRNVVVTPKTINVFSEFAVTLKRIHIRLIAEGYTINEGKIVKSNRLLELEKDHTPPKRKSRRARKD